MTKFEMIKAIATGCNSNASDEYLKKVASKKSYKDVETAYLYGKNYEDAKEWRYAYNIITRGIYE